MAQFLMKKSALLFPKDSLRIDDTFSNQNRLKYFKKMLPSNLTVAVEEFHQTSAWTGVEFRATESSADESMVGQDDDRLKPETDAEDGAVHLGQVRQFQVEISPDERQKAAE